METKVPCDLRSATTKFCFFSKIWYGAVSWGRRKIRKIRPKIFFGHFWSRLGPERVTLKFGTSNSSKLEFTVRTQRVGPVFWICYLWTGASERLVYKTQFRVWQKVCMGFEFGKIPMIGRRMIRRGIKSPTAQVFAFSLRLRQKAKYKV